MTDTPAEDQRERPNTARVYDCLLGGARNFGTDRDVVDDILAVLPTAQEAARLNRAFLRRAVEWITAQGIDQFLDLGAGIPTADHVHQIATRVNPEVTMVYVDNDPVTVAYLSDAFAGHRRIGVVAGDLRDPEAILSAPETDRLLDLSRPVGLLAVAVLHFLPDSDHPDRVLATYREALAPGSLLAASHVTADHEPEIVAAAIQPYARGPHPLITRTRDEFTTMLTTAGFDPIPPGVVWTPEWHPSDPDPHRPERAYCYAAVATTAFAIPAMTPPAPARRLADATTR